MPQATTTRATKTVSLTPQAMEALWRALETMEVSDPKRLASVLVELASEELERSTTFASRVGVLYRALEPVKRAPVTKTSKGSGRQLKGLPADIVPVKYVEGITFDIGAPPNPYFLLEAFGVEQLPRVLNAYPKSGLQEAVEIVQERQPGTRPAKQTKPEFIEYIVKHVIPS